MQVASSPRALGLVLGLTVAAPLAAQDLTVEGGATLVGQWASDSEIREEVVASVDLFGTVDLGPLRLFTYIEANTTPFAGGVAHSITEANTDAGTALDADGTGRVQVSELRLVWPLRDQTELHFGILDPTGFLDVSRIANDENLFFLGVPFVNNPTIGFPDYTLGAALRATVPGTRRVGFAATVTSSHGLADNPELSYGQLFEVDAPHKGVFAGATLRWQGDRTRVSLGGWNDSSDRPRLDGSGRIASNRGLFTVLGWFEGNHALSARLGLADGEVSVNRGFAGATYLWTRQADAVGVAAGRTFVSTRQDRHRDASHLEAFLRRRFVRGVFATWSLQRITNGQLVDLDAPVWVAGVRLSVQF